MAAKKTGRPKVEWTEKDWRTFDVMCRAQTPKEWICEAFALSEPTITRLCKDRHGLTFFEYRKQRTKMGLASLLMKQFEVATTGKGNTTMLIWLGKNYLNQRDNPEFEHSYEAQPITVNIEVDGSGRTIYESEQDPEKLKKSNGKDSVH